MRMVQKKQNRRMISAFLVVMLSIIFLSACGKTDDAAAEDADTTATKIAADAAALTIPEGGIAAEYTDSDMDGAWDETSAVMVSLSETYTIKSAGTYVFSGTLPDGQLIVDAGEADKVQIVLDGASITFLSGAAIWVKNADKVLITLVEGTENELEDASNYVFEGDGTEPDGAIFSCADLTVNGSGALTVNANYADGIVSKGDLKITGGSITIQAKDDCLRGTDSVAVNGGTLNLTAGGDGIKSTEADDEEKGWVSIDGGSITVNAESDGIQAETALTVNGGAIAISNSYEGLEGANVIINGGEIRIKASDDGTNSSGSSTQQTGKQGAFTFDATENYYTLITGGYLYIDAAGDGIDSNGDLYITGGTVVVSGPSENMNGALDRGDGNFVMSISGGTVIAAGSAGMAENFGASSTQASLMVNFESAQNAGTAITLCDASGNVVASFTPAKTFASVIISTPDMKTGETYNIYTGGTVTGEGSDGFYGSGAVLTGGTEYETVTLSSVSTTAGQAGFAGGPGGMKPGNMPQEGGNQFGTKPGGSAPGGMPGEAGEVQGE
jgi:hypothetical protein